MPRPRRGAYIYRRKGRTGWYAFLDRDNKDISLRTDDETEAAQALAGLLESRKIRAIEKGDQALADAFDASLEHAKTNCTAKTIYEIDLNGKRILKWCDGHEVYTTRAVTADVVEHYKTSRIRFEKKSAARVNRELDSWKRAMKCAVADRAFTESNLSIFAHLREPRVAPHQAGLTKAMITRFLRAEKHLGYRAMFRTIVGTGIRDGEMRHYEKKDVRPPWFVVTPKPGWSTKGYRDRSIPITKETAKAARAFVDVRDTLNMDQKGIWKRVQRARKAAKIKQHFSLHDLRRAWASHMLAAGHGIEQISQWLGHANLLTTMRYLRVVRTGTPKPESLPF